jgi:hypothetical protein
MAPRIVPKGPWDTTLNWELCATIDGEIRTHFRNHVRPGPRSLHTSISSFSRFLHLPVELQQHILSFCDGTTLFQLMRASSATRTEAVKLFWSEPNTRYFIAGFWLFAGGFSGYTYANLEALKCVQHIQVDFDSSPSILWTGWEDGEIKFNGLKDRATTLSNR